MKYLIFISGFIPLIIISFFYILVNKVNFKNIKEKVNFNRFLNYIIFTFFIIILYEMLLNLIIYPGALLFNILQYYFPNLSMEYGFGLFYKYFITAGLIEEFAKWLFIKISKPKNKRDIAVISVFLATFVGSFENGSYIHDYGFHTAITRSCLAGHIFFQVIMACFLILAFEQRKKGKKLKSFLLEGIAILVPSLVHGFFDAYYSGITTHSIFELFFAIIIIYGTIFSFLYHYRKNDNENPIEKEKPISKKKFIFKLILAIIIIFLNIYMYK